MGCKQDWNQHDEFCYYLSKSDREFTEAKQDCVNKGSTVTSIHSEEENTFIKGILECLFNN